LSLIPHFVTIILAVRVACCMSLDAPVCGTEEGWGERVRMCERVCVCVRERERVRERESERERGCVINDEVEVVCVCVAGVREKWRR
jgi:hypothetical protein